MRDLLVEELAGEIEALADDAAVMGRPATSQATRDNCGFAYGDLIRGQRLDVRNRARFLTLADALVESATRYAAADWSKNGASLSAPMASQCGSLALGMGKLGGNELNYSSDIDLIFLYGRRRQDGRRPTDVERRILRPPGTRGRSSAHGNDGVGTVYRVDLRLRPEGLRGPVVQSLEGALRYYDGVNGAPGNARPYVKARPVAGNCALGSEFLKQLEPWVYRRYLGLADITGIKALKREVEQRTLREGDNSLNVKTGHGGASATSSS